MTLANGCVFTFYGEIDLRTPERERQAACRALNLHHTGKESLPAPDETPAALQNSHYDVHKTYRTMVRIGVLPSGRLIMLDLPSPVINACGECASMQIYGLGQKLPGPDMGAYCNHSLAKPGTSQLWVDSGAAPPAWCPKRAESK